MAGQVLGKVTAGGGTHLISNTFYGTCDTAASTAAKIVKLTDSTQTAATFITGMLLTVKFTNTNGATSPTLTIQNSSGTQILAAKSIKQYGITSVGILERKSWKDGAVVAFVYDGTNWVEVSSTDDTVSTPHELGFIYATSLEVGDPVTTLTASGNFAGDFVLKQDAIVCVKFSANVGANATLNIQSSGAKPIYYQGLRITADIIKVGNTATFIYDGTNYNLISIDKVEVPEEVVISDTEPDPINTNTKIWVQV